jgi:hypothetical protein
MPDDESMYKYYADPDNRVPAGPGRARKSKPLTTHVPIRFSPDAIAEVKQLADKDRKTVSSWIRDVVEDEVERRRPRIPLSIGLQGVPVTHWTAYPDGVIPPEPLTAPNSESSSVSNDLGVGV